MPPRQTQVWLPVCPWNLFPGFDPPLLSALCVAMEVERDETEGAFVIEDVSAIIKEVRLPARPPAGPRQRSQACRPLISGGRRSRPS